MVEPTPPTPDPEAWTLHFEPPEAGPPSSAQLYPLAFGVAPEHGAKPQPMYWDPEGETWWSLSPTTNVPVERMVWTVDLVQLALQPPEEHRPFLERVVKELSDRMARIGAKVRAPESISEALQRLPAVAERDRLRRATVSILIVPPEPASVRAWWEALEGAGLNIGDGDMFWIDAEDLGFPGEYFEICAEPLSAQGYFHPDDLDGPVTFPDVTLSFQITAPEHPDAVVPGLVNLAEKIAAPLGAELKDPSGAAWSKDRALALIHEVEAKLGVRR